MSLEFYRNYKEAPKTKQGPLSGKANPRVLFGSPIGLDNPSHAHHATSSAPAQSGGRRRRKRGGMSYRPAVMPAFAIPNGRIEY